MILNRAHALLQRCVLDGESEHATVGASVFLRAAIDEVIVILVGQRPERAAGLVDAVNTFAFRHGTTFLLRQRLARMEVDAPRPAIVVVDRYPDMTPESMFAEWRNQRKPWEQPLGNSPVI